MSRWQQIEVTTSNQNQHAQRDSPKEYCTLNTIRDNIDEYGVLHSGDDFDQGTQSTDDNDIEEEKASEHLIKTFGSTINSDLQE